MIKNIKIGVRLRTEYHADAHHTNPRCAALRFTAKHNEAVALRKPVPPILMLLGAVCSAEGESFAEQGCLAGSNIAFSIKR